MTLVAAWIRKNHTLHELVVASDSRLSGGESWDVCPNVIPLPRPATVIAMSGDATEAYTFLLHAINTCTLLEGNKTGRTDLGYLANKLREAYADLRSHVRDLPTGQSTPDVPKLDVALYGWSWRHLVFEGYSFSYDKRGVLQMQSLDLARDRPYPLHLMGDAATEARSRINELMRQRGLPVPKKGAPDAPRVAREAFLGWEPLEILEDLAADSRVRTVGGVPQVVRIYQYGEAEPFVWRTAAGDYFGGRPVQPTERFDRRIMNRDGASVRSAFSDRSIYFGGSAEPTDEPD